MVDDKAATLKMMDEYWKPMWEVSHTGEDCDVQAVMDGLKIDRDGETKYFLSAEEKIAAQKAQVQTGARSEYLDTTDADSS